MLRRVMLILLPLVILLMILNCSKEPVVPDSTSPVINAIEAKPNIVSKGGKVYVNLAVTDREEDKMYFEWSCPNGQFYSDSLLQNVSNKSNPIWWKASEEEGNFTLTVICTDSISEEVDTSITVSVSIYSLDSIIGEDDFSTPFGMYLDASGNLYVSDPGLSCVHAYKDGGYFRWNFAGLDTDSVFHPETTWYNPDSFDIDSIFDSLSFSKLNYESPTAITVDEDNHLLYVADVKLDSTIMNLFCTDSISPSSEDTLYGFMLRMNDRTDLNFRIKSPYSFVINPVSRYLYMSTEISIVCYDSTWFMDGWQKKWSYATAKQGVNFQGKGMGYYNDALYLASFGIDADSNYSTVRRFIDIENPTGPTADDANFWIEDEYTAYVNGVAVSPVNGHIFVTEGGGSSLSFHRVVEYDENGTFVRTFGSLGRGHDQFNFPTNIFVDSDGKIYVVDMGNHCVKVFKE